MRLEGTLDAFSLPDIFQLLSFTKKTGTLHLRFNDQHGVVHLREGAVTGARADASRQELGRRLVGAGLVDDDAFADAVEKVLQVSGSGLGKALADGGTLDAAVIKKVGTEQATDAVFDLLRWPEGEFAFVVDETDPDDLGASVSVEEIVAEGRRRLETWNALTGSAMSTSAVVALAAAPATDPAVNREEWALLALVDGVRSVGDLVLLSGSGEYVVVSVLAGLVERGLLLIGDRSVGASAVVQRQTLLAVLEGKAAPVQEPVADVQGARTSILPERNAPAISGRQAEPASALDRLARLAGTTPTPVAAPAVASASVASSAKPNAPAKPNVPAKSTTTTAASGQNPSAYRVGAVQGAHALQPDSTPDVVPTPSLFIDRDPSVNKSLLLRLIAGVRGL